MHLLSCYLAVRTCTSNHGLTETAVRSQCHGIYAVHAVTGCSMSAVLESAIASEKWPNRGRWLLFSARCECECDECEDGHEWAEAGDAVFSGTIGLFFSIGHRLIVCSLVRLVR